MKNVHKNITIHLFTNNLLIFLLCLLNAMPAAAMMQSMCKKRLTQYSISKAALPSFGFLAKQRALLVRPLIKKVPILSVQSLLFKSRPRHLQRICTTSSLMDLSIRSGLCHQIGQNKKALSFHRISSQKEKNEQHKKNKEQYRNFYEHIRFQSIIPLAVLLASAPPSQTNNADTTENNSEEIAALDIFHAISQEDIQRVRHIIEQNRDQVNAPSDGSAYRCPPLHQALSHYHSGTGKDLKKILEIIHLLLDQGASLKKKDADGATPLHKAIRFNLPLEVIEKMLKLQADPNALDHEGQSAYSIAVQESLLNLKALLERYGGKQQVAAAKINNETYGKWQTNFENHESLADLVGPVPQEILDTIQYLKDPTVRAKYEQIRAKPHKGFLLYGPPGTGKTALARVVAKESGAPFLNVHAHDILSKYIGDTEKIIADIFEQARTVAANSPGKTAILFFDEFDSLAYSRDKEQIKGHERSFLNALLAQLDGFEQNKEVNIIVFAATNKKKSLDQAAIRPGRFDAHICVGLPNREKQFKIMKSLLFKIPYSPLQAEVTGFLFSKVPYYPLHVSRGFGTMIREEVFTKPMEWDEAHPDQRVVDHVIAQIETNPKLKAKYLQAIEDASAKEIDSVLDILAYNGFKPSPADLKKIVEDAARSAAHTKDDKYVLITHLCNAARKHIEQNKK